jgi:predicted Zn-dependent protease with MMP-like domain
METTDIFEQFVAEAVEGLPATFYDRLENVEVVIEDWPDHQALRLAGLRHPAQLLGLYQGVPLTQRTSGYNMVVPDKISLYRQPILLYCRQTGKKLRETIAHVLRHEIAHYFGIDDDRLEEIGAY